MNVHMRKLDDSVFVDVVYSIKNFFGLNIMSILHFHKLNIIFITQTVSASRNYYIYMWLLQFNTSLYMIPLQFLY